MVIVPEVASALSSVKRAVVWGRGRKFNHRYAVMIFWGGRTFAGLFLRLEFSRHERRDCNGNCLRVWSVFVLYRGYFLESKRTHKSQERAQLFLKILDLDLCMLRDLKYHPHGEVLFITSSIFQYFSSISLNDRAQR
jgi:hypothetical protein